MFQAGHWSVAVPVKSPRGHRRLRVGGHRTVRVPVISVSASALRVLG